MLTTTGGYSIREVADGVQLRQGARIIMFYKIKQLENKRWFVTATGKSGLKFHYTLPETLTFGEVFNSCVLDLNTTIDELLRGM